MRKLFLAFLLSTTLVPGLAFAQQSETTGGMSGQGKPIPLVSVLPCPVTLPATGVRRAAALVQVGLALVEVAAVALAAVALAAVALAAVALAAVALAVVALAVVALASK